MNAIELEGVGRRYGQRWALRNLDLALSDQSVVGLVGPNGAGKSTLLHLIVGLIEPSEGAIAVLGERPGSTRMLPDVAFVAQDAPLPRRMRVRELITMTRAMNVRWDGAIVNDRCRELGLGMDDRVASLSGGQRAQLALALALAKRPRLIVLDEPVASLDPLARRTFLQALMVGVAEHELTVIYSTHGLDDLQRTCDHLVVVDQGVLRLAGSIEDILATHAVLVGPADRPLPAGAHPIGNGRSRGRHQHLVRLGQSVIDPHWQQLTPSLEEVILGHLAGDHQVTRHLEVV